MKRLEGLGGVALLEEVCDWGWALRFQKPLPSPVSLSLPADQDVALSTVCAAMLLTVRIMD